MAGSGCAWGAEPPRFLEAFGRLWQVQSRLGSGSSASVYRVRCCGTPGSPPGALKQFLPPGTTGAAASAAEYGFRKERAALERLQGHRNIVTLYGVFTIHFSPNVPSRCLLLELLDVSVSELLLYSSHQGCSMWMIQHCARDVLEALAFLHHEGYVHADLKPRNILWSAENECFKLIDFGLSFKEGNQDVKYIQTDGYRAPEAELQNCLAQAGLQSDTECTSAVDLWSLGIILLEMFSGMKLKHTVRSQEWKANSSAIIDHIFASKAVVNAAIPAYHLRDLIKRFTGNCRNVTEVSVCPSLVSPSGGILRNCSAVSEPGIDTASTELTQISPILLALMLHDDPSRRIPAEMALCSPFFSIPFAPHIEDLVMLPTPVLRLLNVLDDDYLENEEEYEDAVEDVKEECQKYGPVVSLLVPKENPGRGQVFVEYANAGDSKAAQKLLTGRMFDGKFVVATFYPLSAYKRGYLFMLLVLIFTFEQIYYRECCPKQCCRVEKAEEKLCMGIFEYLVYIKMRASQGSGRTWDSAISAFPLARQAQWVALVRTGCTATAPYASVVRKNVKDLLNQSQSQGVFSPVGLPSPQNSEDITVHSE